MKHIIASSLVASSFLFTSCGDKKVVESEAGAAVAEAVAETTPVEAAQNWQKDLTGGQVSNLWSSLSADYQSDLNKLANNLGDKVDSEVYNEAMTTLGSVSNLLKSKKTMILEILKDNAPEGKEDDLAKIEQSYDSIVGIISTIATSDAKTTEGLKSMDLGKLLGDLQGHTKELSKLSSLAGDKFKKFQEVKFSLVSESGDSAAINVTSEGNDKEVKLIKKDGNWLPEDMVSKWPEMMEEANKAIAEIGDMKPEQKQQALMGLMMLKSTVQSLEKAKTKEDMMQTVQGLMGMFGMK